MNDVWEWDSLGKQCCQKSSESKMREAFLSAHVSSW